MLNPVKNKQHYQEIIQNCSNHIIYSTIYFCNVNWIWNWPPCRNEQKTDNYSSYLTGISKLRFVNQPCKNPFSKLISDNSFRSALFRLAEFCRLNSCLYIQKISILKISVYQIRKFQIRFNQDSNLYANVIFQDALVLRKKRIFQTIILTIITRKFTTPRSNFRFKDLFIFPFYK